MLEDKYVTLIGTLSPGHQKSIQWNFTLEEQGKNPEEMMPKLKTKVGTGSWREVMLS